MTHLDRTTFIADVALAARRMGIAIREHQSRGEYKFDWFDGVTHTLVEGLWDKDRMVAAEFACQKLTDYLHHEQFPTVG